MFPLIIPAITTIFSLRLIIISEANKFAQVPYINFLMNMSSTVISDVFSSSSFKLPEKRNSLILTHDHPGKD